MTGSEKAYDNAQRLNAHISSHLYTVAVNTAATALVAAMTTVASVTVSATGTIVRMRGLFIINPTVSGGTLTFRTLGSGGLTLTTSRFAWTDLISSNTVALADYAAVGTTLTGGTIGAGLASHLVTADGWLLASVAGTLNFQIALSSGSANYLPVGSYVDVFNQT